MIRIALLVIVLLFSLPSESLADSLGKDWKPLFKDPDWKGDPWDDFERRGSTVRYKLNESKDDKNSFRSKSYYWELEKDETLRFRYSINF